MTEHTYELHLTLRFSTEEELERALAVVNHADSLNIDVLLEADEVGSPFAYGKPVEWRSL